MHNGETGLNCISILYLNPRKTELYLTGGATTHSVRSHELLDKKLLQSWRQSVECNKWLRMGCSLKKPTYTVTRLFSSFLLSLPSILSIRSQTTASSSFSAFLSPDTICIPFLFLLNFGLLITAVSKFVNFQYIFSLSTISFSGFLNIVPKRKPIFSH